MKALAYVDGSYDKNTGMYGYGVVFVKDGENEEFSGYGKDKDGVWNVAGELAGVRAAIRRALAGGYDELHVCYDYEGIEKWATGAWKAKKPSTKEYVAFIENEVKPRGLKLTFEKVKAHSGVIHNERADELAKQGVAEGNAAISDSDRSIRVSAAKAEETGISSDDELRKFLMQGKPQNGCADKEKFVVGGVSEADARRFLEGFVPEEKRTSALFALKGMLLKAYHQGMDDGC